MEKEQYKEFFIHLKEEGLLIPQIDEGSFDEYIFDNFRAVLRQPDVIKSVCEHKRTKYSDFCNGDFCQDCGEPL